MIGLSAVAAARAQTAEPPCVLDKCLGQQPEAASEPRKANPPGQTGDAAALPGRTAVPMAPGNFDFYVLALSWSPSFCATGGARKAPAQCAAGSNLGFVVHGLWPQNTHGFPSDCGPAGRVPSRQALDLVEGVYPDRGLARYEWIKHGTCTGQSPTDYFTAVRAARDSVVIPEPFRAPRADQSWAPIDVARAFSAANAGLRPDTMAVTCREGKLEEVRICLNKDLRSYVPCPEVARASCHSRQMTAPGLL